MHAPQSSAPPQPSPAGPQVKPRSEHFFGTHVIVDDPHFEGVPPPPHVSGNVHVPHDKLPPQPSPAGPQAMPRAGQVVGVQIGPASGPLSGGTKTPHVLGLPPAPQ
jgi:hypothetical protein